MRGGERHAGNVVDRLFRIKLRTLAADLVEDVDEMRLHVEQPELEHGKKSARARADDEHVVLDRFVHSSSALRLRSRPSPRLMVRRLCSRRAIAGKAPTRE